jgi:hypothetical protein
MFFGTVLLPSPRLSLYGADKLHLAAKSSLRVRSCRALWISFVEDSGGDFAEEGLDFAAELGDRAFDRATAEV